MHVILFEDAGWPDLAPLADVLPVPALAFGASNLSRRWMRALGADTAIVEARQAALACWRDRPEAMDPRPDAGDTVVCVNAACMPSDDLVRTIESAAKGRGVALKQGNRLLAVVTPWSRVMEAIGMGEGFHTYLDELDLPGDEVEAQVLDHPWQLIAWNIDALEADLEVLGGGANEGDVHETAVLTEPDRIRIDEGAEVGPFVVLDASDGPIHLQRDTVIAPHTLVRGPCVVGEGTHLLGGLIGRSTIGPSCRLAGEVEECIWQGRSNKRHHGFVGHSIISEWCNLGALTTTSDLKNNYGPVRVSTRQGDIDSGTQKLGVMLGAHVKTGIGTLLPTGAWVGVGANVFGGGRFAPKHVPAFAWWNGETTETHRFEAFLGTARIAMSRRGERLGEEESQALGHHFEATAFERRAAGSSTS